jgi:hypothetical protein
VSGGKRGVPRPSICRDLIPHPSTSFATASIASSRMNSPCARPYSFLREKDAKR